MISKTHGTRIAVPEKLLYVRIGCGCGHVFQAVSEDGADSLAALAHAAEIAWEQHINDIESAECRQWMAPR